MSVASSLTLSKSNARKLEHLKALEQESTTFKGLVALYRNYHWEPDVASYFFANFDYSRGMVKGRFSPSKLGYDQREREFLAAYDIF